MKKARAPDLTEERIQLVLDTLDGWKGKLTWGLLIEEVQRRTGIEYSRFTFIEYPGIANAFTLRKKTLSGTWKTPPALPRDNEVRAAIERGDRYKAKAERLDQENQLLLEQFVTWAINAERKGVTMQMLNAPLAKPARDQSKKVKKMIR